MGVMTKVQYDHLQAQKSGQSDADYKKYGFNGKSGKIIGKPKTYNVPTMARNQLKKVSGNINKLG